MRKSMQVGTLCLLLVMCAGEALAQGGPKTPNPNDIYCSGMVTKDAPSSDTYVISGEESSYRIGFGGGDYIFINKGSGGGVKIGDEFLIMRPLKSPAHIKWFQSQPYLMRAMGTQWADLGRARVVHVESGVSVALMTGACDFVQRGDIAQPFAPRPAPYLRPINHDRFPAASGKSQGMIVSAKDWAETVGMNDIIYVNVGSAHGSKVGDYVRIFRFQGTRHETVYQNRNTQYTRMGFGHTPVPYKWNDLPREQLGEGIVLRTSENASTVLITFSLRDMYLGDYMELLEPAPMAEAAPPPPPPAKNLAPNLSCSADRGSVMAGERVRVNAKATDPENDPIRYAWGTTGGQLSGTGSTVTLDTTGLAPGRYAVSGQATDGNNAAVDCTVYVAVQAPAAPPQARKMGECAFSASSARVDNVCKRVLDDVSIRMKNDPGSNLVAVGYSDTGETAAAKLSGTRANNIRDYLAASGIASSRINVRPATGQTGAGKQNQRVDLIWLPAGATY
jgi:outer membrane protein OmpA-like peptidoglycan-associated protein